jgi:uncharacterized protein (TIGR02246 family)
MHRLVLSVLSLAFLAACQPATTELTEEQKAAIVDEITRLCDESLNSIRQLDQAGWLAYFRDSEDVTYAEGGEVFRGRSALAEHLRTVWAPFAGFEGDWGELNIQVLAPTVAVVTSRFDFTGVDTAGNETQFYGTWTGVWVEQDGEWKMVNAAETFPAAEASPEDS